MVTVVYNDLLKVEYLGRFFKCDIRPIKLPSTVTAVKRLIVNKERYDFVVKDFPGMPWIMLGAMHMMESNCNFARHLHNGDPLTARTIHVPSGRPPLPLLPPFTWEQSAKDALTLRGFDKWHDWTIEGILWMLECYNGLGYRQYHPMVLSPYLWSGTTYYSRGKYTADGKFSPMAVSMQLGCVPILKQSLKLNLWEAIAQASHDEVITHELP